MLRRSTRTRVLPEEGYRLWAATYDLCPNPLLALEERHLMPLLPPLSGKLVLDLACGTGRWLRQLLTLGARAGVGVDSCAAMLQRAALKPALAGRVTRANCIRLPFLSAVFDFAICSFALSHFDDLDVISRELSLTMKPGAELVLSDVHPEAYSRGWRTGFRYGRTALEIQQLEHSVDEVVETFAAAGFECCELRSERLGEPERPLFLATGKEPFFSSACEIPALLIARLCKV